MPTTRRSTLVSSSSPLEASRSHRRRRRPPPPRPCRHRNASSPSSFVVRVLSNRSTRVCFLFSVFFSCCRRKKERNRVGFRVSVLRTRRRCVFITREKRSAPVAREGSFRRTTVGARLVRRRRRRRSVCAHHQSINQSIDSKKKKKKKTRRVVVYYKIAPFSRRENPPHRLLDDGLLLLLRLSTPFSFSSSPSRGPLSSSSSPSSSLFLLSCGAPIFYRRETISRETIRRDV